ncbi:ribosome biogenesis protein bop1 [Cystoisospora suis]|uniref:Ribosome biogenesis protein bop1 n=1 Tax=Cystoisospora suis TaxID=483139 RepID=A0A2C6KNI0_9APIC|nr:ribosome biogenesis protein bop1 [Cystoisospora suis]
MSGGLGKIKAGREGEPAGGQESKAAHGEERTDKRKKTQVKETGTKARSAGGCSVLKERVRGKTKQPTCSSRRSPTGGSSGSDGESFSKGKLRGLSLGTHGDKEKGKSAKTDHQQRPELASLSGQEEADPSSDFEKAQPELAAEDSHEEHESEHSNESSEDVDDEEESTNEDATEEEEGQSDDEEDNGELSEDFEDDVETEEAEARGMNTKSCSMRGRGFATVLSVSSAPKTASPSSPNSPTTNGGKDEETTKADSKNVLKPSLRGKGFAGGTGRDRELSPKPLLLTGRVADRRLATKGRKENGNRGDEGKPPSRKKEGKGLEKTRLRRFERLLEVPNPNEGPDDLLSDDDEEDNRIGNVPLWWYEKYDHIGYDKDGQKMIKQLSSSAIDQLLAKDDPEGWRTVVDVKNNRKYRLTDTDLEIIRRIRSGAFPSSSYDEEEVLVESDLEDSIFPMHNKPVPKHRFLPSKHEQKKITHLIHLVRSGQLLRDAQARRKKEGPEVFDLWGSSVYVDRREGKSKGHGPPPLPAPKLALPGHAESYNPPEEFLFTEEVKSNNARNDITSFPRMAAEDVSAFLGTSCVHIPVFQAVVQTAMRHSSNSLCFNSHA